MNMVKLYLGAIDISLVRCGVFLDMSLPRGPCLSRYLLCGAGLS